MRTAFWAGLICAVAACSSKDNTSTVPPAGQGGGGGGEGTGTGTGGGDGDDAAAVDATDEVVACGMKSCMPGEYCCDGSCGACAAIGTNCPADPCGTGTGSDAAAE